MWVVFHSKILFCASEIEKERRLTCVNEESKCGVQKLQQYFCKKKPKLRGQVNLYKNVNKLKTEMPDGVK